MRRMQVHLHIERLVLEGVDAGDRAALSAAIEAELAKLLRRPGAIEALGAARQIDRTDGGSFRTAGEAGVEAMGASLARAIHRGLAS
jgi:hypothetical protein